MNEKEWSMEDIMGRIDFYDNEAQRIIRKNTFDVRKLPAEKTTIGKKDKHFWVIFLIFAVICMLGPPLLPNKDEYLSIPPFWIGSFLVGCIFLIISLKKILFRRTIKVTEAEINYSEKGMFGKKQWTENLSDYKGVLRQVWIGSKRHKSFELVLYHEEKGKRIRLFFFESREAAQKAWEAFAKALQIPMLEEKDGEIYKYKG